jgi:Response regulator containing CheY-like receiver domain and AraC-type DNA-binding domain
MYQVLIVDDEVHAVRGLQTGVDWNKLNIATIQTAHSMKQAQEIFQREPIDLMICDIEMPQGSGIDLAEWVRTTYPRVETVFLTCHSDFSYAKRAIQLDSFEYLLKPVDYDELADVIGRALAKINKDQQLRTFEETYHHYRMLWESQQPLMKERFWHDLLRQSIPSLPEIIKEQLVKYDLAALEHIRFTPVIIRIERWRKKLTERDERIMEYALQNASEEQIARRDPNAAIITYRNSSLLAFLPFSTKGSLDELRKACDEYIRFCNLYFYCDLNCYVGEPSHLHEMTSMVDRLNKKDHENVNVLNETLFLHDKQHVEAQIERPPINEWTEWMKQGSKGKLTAEVKRFFQSLREAKGSVGTAYLHSFYQDLLQMLFYVLQMNGLQANMVFTSNLLTDKPESVMRSISVFEEWVQYIIGVALCQLHTADETISIADKVKQYVLSHISEPSLSREDIAKQVYLNPDYLTRVFKKETGLSISDFLQQQRILYAKALLETTDRSISDISLLAGYSNLSYFSLIFKKALDMSPIEYRKQHRKYQD